MDSFLEGKKNEKRGKNNDSFLTTGQKYELIAKIVQVGHFSEEDNSTSRLHLGSCSDYI